MKAEFEEGREKMVAFSLFGHNSELRIHSGKQFKKVTTKDLGVYFSSRAKKGRKLPQGYINVDALEEIVINQEASE